MEVNSLVFARFYLNGSGESGGMGMGEQLNHP